VNQHLTLCRCMKAASAVKEAQHQERR